MATPIENIGQIAIRARDLPASVAFYRDVLGLEYLFEAGTLAFFMCGDVRMMLSPPESDEFDHPSSTVYFRVPDLQAAYEELSERGAKFVDEPHLIAKLPTTSSGWRSSATRTATSWALMSEVTEPSTAEARGRGRAER